MTNTTTDVAIIMGSDSDLPVVEAAFPILESFGVNFTKNVMSAHRTPHEVMELIKSSEDNGCKVFIAAAGMAAHLAGAVASKTVLPVIGVPGDGGPLSGMDALLSTVQMPKGIPVATVAIGSAGAINSAYLAAQILGVESESIRNSLLKVREDGVEAIKATNKKLADS